MHVPLRGLDVAMGCMKAPKFVNIFINIKPLSNQGLYRRWDKRTSFKQRTSTCEVPFEKWRKEYLFVSDESAIKKD
jgi:hypothetical protein